MKYPKITLYIDLLFCIVILPLIIMLVPIDKWITNQTFFVITLIVYLYALYFVYRKANIPALFMQHKYGRIALLPNFSLIFPCLKYPIPNCRKISAGIYMPKPYGFFS